QMGARNSIADGVVREVRRDLLRTEPFRDQAAIVRLRIFLVRIAPHLLVMRDEPHLEAGPRDDAEPALRLRRLPPAVAEEGVALLPVLVNHEPYLVVILRITVRAAELVDERVCLTVDEHDLHGEVLLSRRLGAQ